MVPAAREALLGRFRWEAGHADVWPVFADADALAAVVAGPPEPWRARRVTHVAGVESRGFLLGAAAAVSLGAGFVAVRKAGGPLPGPKAEADADEDYRGLRHRLRLQRAALGPGDRVLLVDDWAERGSQARADRAREEPGHGSAEQHQRAGGVRAGVGAAGAGERVRRTGSWPQRWARKDRRLDVAARRGAERRAGLGPADGPTGGAPA